MINNIETTQAFKNALEKVNAEKTRQDKILHDDPPLDSHEVHVGQAFNLGFSSTEAMSKEIKKNPKVFMEIYDLAVKKIISYDEAEEELRKVDNPDLISEIKRYQNLKAISKTHKKEPGPPKIYINKHKSRPKTRAQVYARYELFKSKS